MDLSYLLNHLGEDRELYFDAVAPPITQSTNFCQPTVQALRERIAHEYEAPFYTRGVNPTVAILRKKIAALEGADDALVFSSGSAAIAAAVCSLLRAGDHVVCVRKPYSWTHTLLNTFLARFGVTTTMVDGTDAENYRRAITPQTRLLLLESPNSMTFELQDIAAVTAIAREHGCYTLMDNSYSTPLFQQPLAMGVDLVAHSASKYLSGHSDVVAGALAGRADLIRKVFTGEFMTLGASISPHDAWLILRGLRTLSLRMERAASSALKVADFLATHPKVSRLNYPYHPSHPQYELARKQMKNGSGLLSIEVRTESFEGVERFANALQRFLMATSWGGYESLAFPVCAFRKSKEAFDLPLPWNLVRLYIGLEDPELLIADLAQALDQV